MFFSGCVFWIAPNCSHQAGSRILVSRVCCLSLTWEEFSTSPLGTSNDNNPRVLVMFKGGTYSKPWVVCTIIRILGFNQARFGWEKPDMFTSPSWCLKKICLKQLGCWIKTPFLSYLFCLMFVRFPKTNSKVAEKWCLGDDLASFWEGYIHWLAQWATQQDFQVCVIFLPTNLVASFIPSGKLT